MRKYWLMLGLVFSFIIIAQSPQRALLQGDEDCPVFIEQALNQVGDSCAFLPRNSMCYGFNRVDATFTEAVAEDFFTKPSDQTELTTLETVAAAPLDAAIEQWGIAVMSVQANIPDTLPGQSVKFILLGDVEVTNAVSPEEAAGTGQTITVTANANANIRSRPTTSANVIGSVRRNTDLTVNAISPDGQWLRVQYSEVTEGWISVQLITTQDDITSLTVADGDQRTPMQAFYFKEKVGTSSCTQAPSLLLIQGPDNFTVNLNGNGVDIQLSSTAVLALNPDGSMLVGVVSGSARVGRVIVPEGFAVDAPLSADGRSLDGTLSGLRPLTQDELDNLQYLEKIPTTLLNYQIDVPDRVQTLATAAPAAAQPSGCEGFALTSPLDGWGQRTTAFYWNAAPGATSYRLTTPSGVVETTGLNASINLSQTQGTTLTWTVQALINGQVTCTATTTIPRDLSITCPTTATC